MFQPIQRREFFKRTLGFTFLAGALGQLGSLAGQAWAQAKELIDIDGKKRKDKANEDAVKILKPLNYVADADAAEKAGKLKRADKPHPGGGTMVAKKQICSNCALFDAALIDKGQPGTCMLANMVLVHAKGYCSTYSPHANSKV